MIPVRGVRLEFFLEGECLFRFPWRANSCE